MTNNEIATSLVISDASNVIAHVISAQSITDALNERRSLELAAHTLNDNKANTLRKLANYARESVASAFNSANVDLAFISSRRRVDAMFDVYAIEKCFDLADYYAQSNTVALNHYTLAIARSAANFTSHNAEFTLDAVRSACSSLEKCRDAKKEKLVVKYDKDVKASTVNAQHRSSLEALKLFGVLREKRTSSNDRAFVVGDSEFAKTFMAKIAM